MQAAIRRKLAEAGPFTTPLTACPGVWQGCLVHREPFMNRFERASPASGEAEIEYRDGEFRIVRPGAFVFCGVSGQAIPLEELRYWDVMRQEAYASPQEKLIRIGAAKG